MTVTVENRGRPLAEIETWVFDLDNTLYPATCNLFVEVETRMAAFICSELGIETEAAHALRRHYFRTHGTTLRGLMNERGIDPRRFLDYVHAIDMSSVQPAPALAAALAALPGRKIVFTNADVQYAERVLDRLGIAGHFDGLFDIHAADYRPKPDRHTYDRFVARFAIDPSRAVMVEDIAQNLVPAHALGMTTAWIPGGPEWAKAEPGAVHVHHVVEDLALWLAAAVATPRPSG
ncbi:MAG TPA: pyrimidine 5'-nucleotidase [Stellaceae bacterium]|nr:pyrimidine 5'-nucleotidase [Stellaceae bacterium]